MGFIYKITNTINNKAYIGITTKTPEERWKAHLAAIKRGKGCPLLRYAINKYGADKFNIETIIICFDEALFKLEIDYIKKYNTMAPNGYNAHEGGNGGACFAGKTHSQETKDKLRNIMCEKMTPEYKIQIGKFVSAGLKNSDKWKKAVEEGRVVWKMDICKKGTTKNHLAPEKKNKISISVKNYFNKSTLLDRVEKHKKSILKSNGTKIEQYSLDNILIKQFDSIIETSTELGIGATNIQSNVSGRAKTAGGYIWKYVNNTLINKKTEQYKEIHREIMRKKLGKRIEQYSLENNLINEFSSIAEASRDTNICRSTIGEVATGKKKTAGGYIWKFSYKELKD